MAFGAHAEYGTQSASKVRPAATTEFNSPQQTSKKAKRMNMSPSHRWGTDYGLSAVMLSWRGDEDERREQHGDMVQQNFYRNEAPKKSSSANMPNRIIGGARGGQDANFGG